MKRKTVPAAVLLIAAVLLAGCFASIGNDRPENVPLPAESSAVPAAPEEGEPAPLPAVSEEDGPAAPPEEEPAAGPAAPEEREPDAVPEKENPA